MAALDAQLSVLPLDVTCEVSIMRAAQVLQAEGQRLSLLVNCAGFLHEAGFVPAREAPTLSRLLERYLGDTESRLARWLLSREASEATIRIQPCWLTAWDYGARMGS